MFVYVRHQKFYGFTYEFKIAYDGSRFLPHIVVLTKKLFENIHVILSPMNQRFYQLKFSQWISQLNILSPCHAIHLNFYILNQPTTIHLPKQHITHPTIQILRSSTRKITPMRNPNKKRTFARLSIIDLFFIKCLMVSILTTHSSHKTVEKMKEYRLSTNISFCTCSFQTYLTSLFTSQYTLD